MRIRNRLSFVAVISLLVSLFSPLGQAAQGAGSAITETVTVHKPDNSTYPGAVVSFVYYDRTTNLQGLTTPVTANGSGVATVTWTPRADLLTFGLVVEPPAGDVTNAIYMTYQGTPEGYSTTASISVTLSPANLKLNVKKPDGTAAPVGTNVNIPNGPGFVLPRTGAFGVVLNGSADAPGSIDIQPISPSERYLLKSFGVTFDNAGAPTIYTDMSGTTPLAADGNGIYNLQFTNPTFHGVVKTSAGGAYTYPAGQLAKITLHADYGNGNSQESQGRIFSDGTILADFSPTGAAIISTLISAEGSTASLSFAGPDFYSNASGNFATTQAGSYQTPANFSLEVRLPAGAANFTTQIFLADGTTVSPGFINIAQDMENGREVGRSSAADGTGKFLLADGTYHLFFQSWVNPWPSADFRVEVTAGVAHLFDSSSTEIAAVNGVFPIKPVAPNFKATIIDPRDSSLVPNGGIEFRLDGNGRGYGFNQGHFENKLADGVYEVYVRPNTSDLASTKFVATVTSGVVTLTTAGGTPIALDADGTFHLVLNQPNVLLNFIDPRNSNLITNGGLSYNLQGGNTGYGDEIQNGQWRGTLTDGIYDFSIFPNDPDLSEYRFTVHIDSGIASVYSSAGVKLSANQNGSFDVVLATSNVSFHVINPLTNQPVLTGGISYNAINGGNGYGRGINNGSWSANISDGAYNINVQPQDDGLSQSQLTLTVSGGGTVLELKDAKGNSVTQNEDKSFNIIATAANVTAQLVDGSGNVLKPGNFNNSWRWLNVQVQKLDSYGNWNYVANANVSNTTGTIYASAVEVGQYRLRIEPNGFDGAAVTYSDPFEITEQNKTDFSINLGQITAKSPNFKFKVTSPDGTTTLVWSWLDLQKPNGEWVDNMTTGNLGQGAYAFSAAGTYRLVAQPNGNATGASGTKKIYNLTVTDDGNGGFVVAIDGVTPNGDNVFVLPLSAPQLSGSVTSPDGSTTLANSQVVAINQSNQQEMWEYSAVSNYSGQWAMSLPAGNYKLRARGPWGNATYSDGPLSGLITVDDLGNVTVPEGQSATAFELRVANPTWSGVLQDPNGDPIPYVGICFTPAYGFNGYCPNTDSSGRFAISLPDGFTGFDEGSSIWVNDPSGKWPSLNLRGSDAVSAVFGSYTPGGSYTDLVVQLPTPNFKGIVRDADNQVAQWTWVEVFNEDTNEWIGGSSTGQAGLFSLDLAKPASGVTNYRLTVYPNGNGSKSVRAMYSVVVAANGDMTVTTKADQTPVSTESVYGQSGYYSFKLGSPSASGFVYQPDGTTTVPWSQVVPYDPATNWGMWEQGTNSDASGAFNLGLADGSYRLQAEVPWNMTGVAKSAMCDVTIGGSKVTSTESDCVNADGSIKLKLRDANLKMKMVHGGNAVPFTNVSLWIGNYSVWAQAAQDGSVSFFIDSAEVERLNAWATNGDKLKVNVSVNAPWDNSDVVGWQCESGQIKLICAQLPDFTVGGTEYSAGTIDLLDVEMLTPNAQLHVTYPNGNAAEAGGWVGLFKLVDNCTGCRNWVGWGNTDANGVASFNLDESDTNARYVVEVHAPWIRNALYASKTHDNGGAGYTFAELTDGRTFQLASPNLKMTVIQALGSSRAKWSGVGITQFDGNNEFWIGGYGTDQQGQLSVFLPENGTFKIYIWPGPGSIGTQTTCIVTTDADGVVSVDGNNCGASNGTLANGEVTLTLDAGNVQGHVYEAGTTTGVAGAIVYASADDGNGGTVEQKTTTDANGKFGLQLDQNRNWSIKVFYVNVPGAAVQLGQILSPVTLDLTGQIPVVQDFELAVL